jgi:nickel superoxide dismutase
MEVHKEVSAMRRITLAAVVLSVLLLSTQQALSHCEVPCGIYDDEMRCDMIEEHITTIEKAMKMIVSLSREADTNYNQLVRWVDNKERHAGEIQSIVSQYFMTQRVKPVTGDEAADQDVYVVRLTLLHEMLVHAMKAKQTTDTVHASRLRELLTAFRVAYFGADHEKHGH